MRKYDDGINQTIDFKTSDIKSSRFETVIHVCMCYISSDEHKEFSVSNKGIFVFIKLVKRDFTMIF